MSLEVHLADVHSAKNQFADVRQHPQNTLASPVIQRVTGLFCIKRADNVR
jgi:hypothetical protein